MPPPDLICPTTKNPIFLDGSVILMLVPGQVFCPSCKGQHWWSPSSLTLSIDEPRKPQS
jgi:hypothetical protein